MVQQKEMGQRHRKKKKAEGSSRAPLSIRGWEMEGRVGVWEQRLQPFARAPDI